MKDLLDQDELGDIITGERCEPELAKLQDEADEAYKARLSTHQQSDAYKKWQKDN